MTINRDQLLADLWRDEGFRPFIYDDANGEPVVPGYTLIGNATLAVGWCPAKNPCPEDLARMILGYFVDDRVKQLQTAISWFQYLPEPVARALANMAYQLGVNGLLGFKTFLPLIQRGDYKEAAEDLPSTLWFKQSGQRGPRIQALIQTCGGSDATA